MSSKPKSKNSKPYQRKGSTKTRAIKPRASMTSNEEKPKQEPETARTNHATHTATNTQTRKVSENKTELHSSEEIKKAENQSSPRSQGLTPDGKTQSKHNSNMSPDKRHVLIGLIIVGVTILVGVIATLLGGKMDDSYVKPPAYPPNWVFPVAWSIIYISIAIASYLAYIMVADDKKRRGDVIWYSIHLFFNFMWPLFYFTLGWLIFSCVWLGFVIATAIIVTYRFYRANLTSGIIFTIYTLWLIYALYLSLGITILNA